MADSDLTPEAIAHIQKRYLALLLMTDEYLGNIFSVMDRHHMWEDTFFLYTTDHGYMAKNYMPAYNEVFHIPLIVHLPGGKFAGRRVKALTQNIDIMPTLLEYYGIPESSCRNPLHGRSLLPLIEGSCERTRDVILYGYFGKQMNVTDGRYTYFRSPNAENRPLNLYTAMPTDIREYFYSPFPDAEDRHRISDPSRITLAHLPWTPYPVFKIPADAVMDNDDGSLRYVRLYDWEMEDQLYDLEQDYAQMHNLAAREPETVRKMQEKMRQLLRAYDAPAEQYERLRLEDTIVVHEN